MTAVMATIIENTHLDKNSKGGFHDQRSLLF